MRIEFSEQCGTCEKRPACEIAGQKGARLERAAKEIGFTVTEGSVICHGRERGSALLDLDARCGTRIQSPVLASEEERSRITKLAELEDQADALLGDTQSLIIETLGS